jgi:hypothetical protein
MTGQEEERHRVAPFILVEGPFHIHELLSLWLGGHLYNVLKWYQKAKN